MKTIDTHYLFGSYAYVRCPAIAVAVANPNKLNESDDELADCARMVSGSSGGERASERASRAGEGGRD